MVRLKAIEHFSLDVHEDDFNSSMVRLKVSGSQCYNYSVEIFQFLNGAIKSSIRRNGAIPASVFQFLNGAIKSIYQANSYTSLLHFNSSMVRLKAMLTVIMVRLRKHSISIPQWCD